jgi:vancomycin resistance protein YoaR
MNLKRRIIMSRKKFIISAVLLLSIFFVFLGNESYASADEKDNQICKGVFIDEVDVSGMTKEEAKEAVDNFVEGLRGKGVAIRVGEDIVYTTLGDLGYTYEPNDNIDQALALGKTGNLIKRYKDLKDIEYGNKVYPLTYTLDDTKLKELVSVEVGAYNIEPVNATVKIKNDEFKYTDHVVGRKVNVDQTSQTVKDAILNNWNRTDVVVEAVLEDDMPVYTRDIVELCNTKLGSFTTDFASSAEGRAANLANGARLINNAVLYPGDVFSGYEFLTPFSKENGYDVAGAYLDGKVIDSVGGGACQVTTTLYNAVLLSELEVVQRDAHSMTISYVDLSRDAAIAGTWKDFKFKNNTDAPILIEAYTHNRKITFTIWGHETRDTNKRTVEYESVVLSTTEPGPDKVTKDPTKPTTYLEVTQSAHTGYKAELYKIVYENGVEVSRTLINKSSYAAEPRYVIIGTKKVDETDKDKAKDKDKDKDTQKEEVIEDFIEENIEVEDPSTGTNSINQANPDDQIQADIWDPAWDLEEPRDE